MYDNVIFALLALINRWINKVLDVQVLLKYTTPWGGMMLRKYGEFVCNPTCGFENMYSRVYAILN